MPATSKSQFRMIQAIKSKYDSKDKAPEKDKWAFESEWTNVDYDKLPEEEIRQRYQRFFPEAEAKTVGGFKSPSPGDLPEKGADILAKTYASCRKGHGKEDKENKKKCSKIAWSSVHKAGY